MKKEPNILTAGNISVGINSLAIGKVLMLDSEAEVNWIEPLTHPGREFSKIHFDEINVNPKIFRQLFGNKINRKHRLRTITTKIADKAYSRPIKLKEFVLFGFSKEWILSYQKFVKACYS